MCGLSHCVRNLRFTPALLPSTHMCALSFRCHCSPSKLTMAVNSITWPCAPILLPTAPCFASLVRTPLRKTERPSGSFEPSTTASAVFLFMLACPEPTGWKLYTLPLISLIAGHVSPVVQSHLISVCSALNQISVIFEYLAACAILIKQPLHLTSSAPVLPPVLSSGTQPIIEVTAASISIAGGSSPPDMLSSTKLSFHFSLTSFRQNRHQRDRLQYQTSTPRLFSFSNSCLHIQITQLGS